MNATNPFQIPSCLQVDRERRRRERFKKTFIALAATSILLLVGLLIAGCINERARTVASAGMAAEMPEPPAVAAVQNTISSQPPNPQTAMSKSTTPVPKASIPPAGHPDTICVVKTGDTLTRIARANGTTVRNLEAVNGLVSDHIAVGTRLKLPEM